MLRLFRRMPGLARAIGHQIERGRCPLSANSRRRSARVYRVEAACLLLTDRACSNRFFNLLLNSGHIETGAALHRWEIDKRLRRLRHLLLDENEAPELVGEPVVIGD